MPSTATDPSHDHMVRLRRMLRWAVGMIVTGLRYFVDRVPMYRRNRHPFSSDELPDLGRPVPGDADTLQRAADGVGPLFHRRYWIDVTDTALGPEALIDAVTADLNAMAPQEMSRFEAPDGADLDRLDIGDELVVRLPGPWDGPVRVIERTPTSFRFATLVGHMEAGEIEFSSSLTDKGWVRFQIESWARSGSRMFDVLYDRLPLAREAQLLMWSRFCRRASKLTGGIVMSNVQALTQRIE